MAESHNHGSKTVFRALGSKGLVGFQGLRVLRALGGLRLWGIRVLSVLGFRAVGFFSLLQLSGCRVFEF